jgi:hypothetical protein
MELRVQGNSIPFRIKRGDAKKKGERLKWDIQMHPRHMEFDWESLLFHLLLFRFPRQT